MKKAESATTYPQITIWTSIWKKYIEQAGIKDDPKGPLFRTVFGRTDKLQRELKDVKKVPAYQRVLQFTRRRAARIFI